MDGTVALVVLVGLITVGLGWSLAIVRRRAKQIPTLLNAISRAKVREAGQDAPTQIVRLEMLPSKLNELARKKGSVAAVIAQAVADEASQWWDAPEEIQACVAERLEAVYLSAVWSSIQPTEGRPPIDQVRKLLRSRADTEYCFNSAANYAERLADTPESGRHACAA